MLLRDVLHAIIDDGMESVRLTYRRPDEAHKLNGALKGFEECRNKNPPEIGDLIVAGSGAHPGSSR